MCEWDKLPGLYWDGLPGLYWDDPPGLYWDDLPGLNWIIISRNTRKSELHW